MNRDTLEYNRYRVQFFDLEWDADPKDENYNAELVRKLPKEGEITVNAPDEACARDWAMNDFSDNHSYCIVGCRMKVTLVTEESSNGIETSSPA